MSDQIPTFDQFWKAFIAEVDRRAFSARELENGRHSEAFIGSIEWHRAAAKEAWEKLVTGAPWTTKTKTI